MVERVVEADSGQRIVVRPIPRAVEDDAYVVGFLLLQVQRGRVARGVTRVIERRGFDGRVRRDRVAELERAADELRCTGESPGVDERLQSLRVDVPVPYVDDDDAEEKDKWKD